MFFVFVALKYILSTRIIILIGKEKNRKKHEEKIYVNVRINQILFKTLFKDF